MKGSRRAPSDRPWRRTGFGLLAAAAAVGLGAVEARASVETRRQQPVVRAVERVAPAVVNISTEQIVERPADPFGSMARDPFFGDFFRDFFEIPRYRQRERRSSLGSGVIIDPAGYVVTNEHVVLQGSSIAVRLQDGRQFPATLVGADPESDLAVLRLDAPGETFPAARPGRSDEILLGETVIAIGNPFGFSHTVTTGIVSAVNRGTRIGNREYRDLIQTDAAINPGNSGGPLLNIDGEMIGINTAIFAGEHASGIGFAIPADRVRRISSDLIRFGEVHAAWLGVGVQDLTPDLAGALGVESGVLIQDVKAGSPADRVGLRKRDVIVEMAGRPVRSTRDFRAILVEFTDGDEIPLRVQRDGEGSVVEVRARATSIPEDVAWENFCRLIGVDVADAGGDAGVVVTRVYRGGRAYRVGIRRGDVINQLGEQEIANLKDFQARAARAVKASTILLRIVRGPHWYYVTLPVS